MHKSFRTSSLALALTAAAVLFNSSVAAAQTSPPNILFILADDLGWRDLGCYGSPFYETPNIDQLAAEGMRFTAAYAACPVCSPTRASIMTGKYPARMATTDWFGAPQPDTVPGNKRFAGLPLIGPPYLEHLPLEETTIAEALKAAGYSTFFAGKWHLGGEGFSPEDQGFDENQGGFYRGSPPGGYFSPYKNPKLEDGPEGEHLPGRLAKETARFIRENKEAPFFAFLSFYSVHTPLMTRPELEHKYQQKADSLPRDIPVWGQEGARKVRLVQDHPIYAGMVEAMDDAVGTVLQSLSDAGVRENTVIFFMSDNGGLSTSEGSPTSNLPLRAGKGWLYEGGVREPMIVKWPSRTQSGSVCTTPVTSTDFYPTILEIAGLDLVPSQHIDGHSMLPLLLQTGPSQRGAIYWHYPHYGNQGANPGSSILQDNWKLIKWYESGRIELFNITEDLSEQTNLAAQFPKKVQELKTKLDQWLNSVSARMPTPNPNATPPNTKQ